MKKYILFFVIMVSNLTIMNAQTFKEYFPKEGLPTAVAQAINTGITTPLLFLVATTSEKSPSMPAQLTPKIDLTTGAATVWLFQFRDNADTSKQILVAVVKVSLFGSDQFIPSELPVGSLSQEIPSLTKPLPGTSWMNSDTMMTSINSNSFFQNFKNTHTNTRIQSTILGINTFNPMFEMDLPYWFAIITGDNAQKPINCITSSKTGETTCLEVNSIAIDNHGNPVSIYPNPAKNLLTVEIPKNWTSSSLQISIFNYSGNEVLRSSLNNTKDYLQLPLNYLPNGEYIISLSDGKNSVEQLFVVSK
jgi:hypothetical protein